MPKNYNINSDYIAVQNINSLRSLRKSKGLTARALAIKLGVSDTQIQDVETGKTSCSVLLYNSIACIFNWPPFVEYRPRPQNCSQELSLGFEDTLPQEATSRKRDLTVCFNLPLYEAVRKIAEDKHIPLSHVINVAVQFYLTARDAFTEAHHDH